MGAINLEKYFKAMPNTPACVILLEAMDAAANAETNPPQEPCANCGCGGEDLG